MRHGDTQFAGPVLDRFAEDAEHLQMAISTRTATVVTPDGALALSVSADGRVHNWQLARAIDLAPESLMAIVVDLVEQGRAAAQRNLRDDLEKLTSGEELRAVRDAVRDALAVTPTPPKSRVSPLSRASMYPRAVAQSSPDDDEPFSAESIWVTNVSN